MSFAVADQKSVQKIKDAISPMIGCKPALLINVFGSLRNQDCLALSTLYLETFRRDLEKDLKKKLTSDFETVCVALQFNPTEYDAKLLMQAFKGLGTNEDLCLEVICTRTDEELKAISAQYQQFFQKPLNKRVHSELGGKVRALCERVLQGRSDEGDVKTFTEELYRAGEGKMGTDEKTFIRILAGHSRRICEAIADQYLKSHGKTLQDAIKSEFGGDLRQALLALVTPLPQFFAEKIHGYFTAVNTNEKGIIRIIRSRKEKDLTEISNYLKTKMKRNKTLMEWVNAKTGAKLKPMLVAVCANFV